MKLPPSPLRAEIRQAKPFRSASEEAAVGLLYTAEKLRRRLADALESEKITPQQYNVLRILRGSHPEALQTLEIAARMLEATPGITRLLDRLEAKRFVGRDRGREDRRCVHVRITAQGLALLERLDEPMLAAAADGFRGLDRRGLLELSALLDRVRAGLRPEATVRRTGAGREPTRQIDPAIRKGESE